MVILQRGFTARHELNSFAPVCMRKRNISLMIDYELAIVRIQGHLSPKCRLLLEQPMCLPSLITNTTHYITMTNENVIVYIYIYLI